MYHPSGTCAICTKPIGPLDKGKRKVTRIDRLSPGERDIAELGELVCYSCWYRDDDDDDDDEEFEDEDDEDSQDEEFDDEDEDEDEEFDDEDEDEEFDDEDLVELFVSKLFTVKDEDFQETRRRLPRQDEDFEDDKEFEDYYEEFEDYYEEFEDDYEEFEDDYEEFEDYNEYLEMSHDNRPYFPFCGKDSAEASEELRQAIPGWKSSDGEAWSNCHEDYPDDDDDDDEDDEEKDQMIDSSEGARSCTRECLLCGTGMWTNKWKQLTICPECDNPKTTVSVKNAKSR